MNLDAKALRKEAFADARALLEPKAKELGERGRLIAIRFVRLEGDVEATLEQIGKTSDTEAAKALHADLELALPARKAFLLAAVEAELGSATKAVLDAALEIGIKIVLAVARSFVPVL